jgi:hypothetical protein
VYVTWICIPIWNWNWNRDRRGIYSAARILAFEQRLNPRLKGVDLNLLLLGKLRPSDACLVAGPGYDAATGEP